jgi:hypothetical protein
VRGVLRPARVTFLESEMVSSFMRSVCGLFGPKRAARRRSFQPQLESLGERVVPAVVWGGTVSQDANNAARAVSSLV